MTTTDQTADQTTTDVYGSAGTHWIRRAIMALLVAAFAVTGVNTSPASAWVQSSGDGSYGQVTLRGAAAQGSYYKAPGALYGQTLPHLNVRGVVAHRSAATSGYQSVTYKFVIYRWNGSSWGYWGENWAVTQGIPQGYGSTDFAPHFFRTASAPGYYRVTLALNWYDAAGRRLGGRSFDYNAAGDYVCYIGPCATGPGYIYF